MVSTSGAQLLPDAAISTLLKQLLPITTILTPNIPEAKLLVQHAGIQPPEVSSLADLVKLAKSVGTLGPQHVLLKGGHFPVTQSRIKSNPATDLAKFIADVLVTAPTDNNPGSNPRVIIFQTAYVPTPNTHGTGCSLASAIACNLALGCDIPTAVGNSVQYIERAILAAKDWRLGQGNGPIDHLYASRKAEARENGPLDNGPEGGSTMIQWDWEENNDSAQVD